MAKKKRDGRDPVNGVSCLYVKRRGGGNRNVLEDDEEILGTLQNSICCAHANWRKRSLHTVISVRFEDAERSIVCI